jgi:hypothetical protein
VDKHGASLTFADAFAVAKEVMDRYEEQSANECREIKEEILAFPNGASGSVLLADLHRAALEGKGTFQESTDYLRKAGALDERNPEAPKVMVPNYVYGPSNCLGTTSFFDVCCPNECDLILEHLEQSLLAPAARPSQLASSLAKLPRELGVPAHGRLSPIMLGELEEIAQGHDGTVALHGRAFFHWLHLAFPRECPRPRSVSSSSKGGAEEVPDTVEEYQAVAGMNTVSSMVASKNELELDAKVNASLPVVLPFSTDADDLPGSSSLLKHVQKAAGLSPGLLDVTSFAQTGVVHEPAHPQEQD